MASRWSIAVAGLVIGVGMLGTTTVGAAGRLDQPFPTQSPVQPGTIQALPATTLPPATTQMTVWVFADIKVSVLGPTSVQIEWMSRPDAVSYRVMRNGSPIGDVAAGGPLGFVDQGLTPGTTASYAVLALRPPGSDAMVAAQKPGTLVIAEGTKGGFSTDVLEESRTVTVTTPTPPVIEKSQVSGKFRRPPSGMTIARWVLNPDPVPSIPAGSKVLLFIHGMDSRAEEADDFTKALFMTVTPTPATPPPALPPIAANRSTVNFTQCANPAGGCPETCDNPDDFSGGQRRGVVPPMYFAPFVPRQLLDMSPPPGTPIPPGAQFNVPAARNIGTNEGRLIPQLRAVARAANALDTLRMAATDFASGNALMGNALADLAVTGSRSFAAFRQALPAEPFCQSLALNIQDGCRTALDRAYRVANFLRSGQRGDTPALKAAKIAERNALGWIAVSGEDDLPHRPVNVPSSDAPQFDLIVTVGTQFGTGGPVQPVHTRYTIAQSQTPGNNLVVIAMDLPTSGYAGNLDYNLISPLALIGQPRRMPITNDPFDFAATGATPLLDFLEGFIARFVMTLDSTVPFKNNIKAVMGGSLGGNMTFRLGRNTSTPWLPKFVVWSPASIWDSLGAGSDLAKHQGPLHAWLDADKAMASPGPGDRAAFFATWDKAIVPVVIPMAQSDTWTSDFYPCKKSAVAAARLDRQETYDAMFLAWHWRLGGEQLLFSHQTRDASGRPLWMSNVKPMLLACGVEDRVPFNDICPATQNTAQQMLTPGKALFLGQTGHSLDNERRSFFAREVVQFLGL